MREEGDLYISALKDRELALALRRQETKAAAALRARARSLLKGVARADAPERSGDGGIAGPGMAVVIEGLGVRGTVESIRGDKAVVLVRGKRTTVALQDCRPERGGSAREEGALRLPPGVTLSRRPPDQTSDEIQLLGRTVQEALELVDKYLDDVYLARVSPVRLIHGVGSGRLKKAITALLAGHPHVEGFASAPPDQGGAGVTIVRLRL